jgi:hypothetical protein
MRKFYVVLALIMCCGIAMASKEFPMTSSSVVPAARGRVEVDKDKNGNLQVNVHVEHLANPQNLTPAASSYVVWLQDRAGAPENKGQMKVDKNLNGSLEMTTSLKSFDLFITGEKDFNARTPGGTEVLRASIQQQ